MKRVYDEELVPKQDVILDGSLLKKDFVYTVDHLDAEGHRVLVKYSGGDNLITVKDIRPFRVYRKGRWEFGPILGPIVSTAAIVYLAVAWSITPGKGKTRSP